MNRLRTASAPVSRRPRLTFLAYCPPVTAVPRFPPGVTFLSRGGRASLRVGEGARVPSPIRLPWKDERSLSLHLEPSADVTLFLDVLPRAGERTLEAELQESARLSLIILHRGGEVAESLRQSHRIGARARLCLFGVTLGKDAEQRIETCVEGVAGESIVSHVFRASGDDRQTLAIRSAFVARDGKGTVAIRGVADGRAHVRCDGLVAIGEGGGGADAHLTQDVLMLDASAKVDAVPALEVRTNDVRAGHAATVTKVSEEDLFYAAARGIPRDAARAMIVRGFLSDLLDKIEEQEVRTALEKALEEKSTA